jgi:hypothetical protein
MNHSCTACSPGVQAGGGTMPSPLTHQRVLPPPQAGLHMNTDLQNFLRPLAQVITATLLAVCTVAFVSVPYSIGRIPGEPAVHAQADAARHMT